MKQLLSKAIQIAVNAHQGQYDKAGEPYILHPLRVMSNKLMSNDAFRIIAVLHDVLEDTTVTEKDLKQEGFPKHILDALRILTRNESSYEDYVKRIKKNNLSRLVKIADLEDNMDVKRLRKETEKDKERLEKYKKAYAFLSV